MNNLDLYEYAEENNIAIEHVDLPINKALSVQIEQAEYIGMDKNVSADSAEERTLLAHELGHCATGAFYDEDTPKIIRSRQEHRAIKWALLRCVPKSELLRLIREKYHNDEIADIFGVTEEFLSEAYTYYFEYGIAG